MSLSVELEQQPEQIELPTFMDPETRHDPSMRDLEEDERLLSQSENDKSAETSSKYLQSFQQFPFAYSNFYIQGNREVFFALASPSFFSGSLTMVRALDGVHRL